MAIQNIVNDGFLLAASELETVGQQAVLAWQTALLIRQHKDARSDFEAWRTELLKSDYCRLMVYGANPRFAKATARISMIHGALYYVMVNSYVEICKLVKFLTLEPADSFLTKAQESAWKLISSYYRFGASVAAKAAEVLVEDRKLVFDTAQIRKNERLVRLIDLCEQFKANRNALVKMEQGAPMDATGSSKCLESLQERVNQLNDWMLRAIEGDAGLASI